MSTLLRKKVMIKVRAADVAALDARMAAAKKPSVSAVKKIVQGMITKNEETKNTVRLLENYVLHNSPILGNDWTYPLPPVTVGTGEDERIGDRLKPKALVVKLHVAVNSALAGVGFKPVKVRVHVVKHKKFTSQAQLALNMPVDGLLLLDEGDGNIGPYDGTIENSQYSLNTDLWTAVKTLNFTIAKDNTAPTTGSAFREFTIRIPCPKTLVYTAGALLPENFCPAMAVGYCYVDGSGPDIVNTPIMVYARSYFTYTDA